MTIRRLLLQGAVTREAAPPSTRSIDLSKLSDAKLMERSKDYGRWLKGLGERVDKALVHDPSGKKGVSELHQLFPATLPARKKGSDLVFGGLFRAKGGQLTTTDPSSGVTANAVTTVDGRELPNFISMFRKAMFYQPSYLDTKTGSMYAGFLGKPSITGPLKPPPALAIFGDFSPAQIQIIQKGITDGLR